MNLYPRDQEIIDCKFLKDLHLAISDIKEELNQIKKNKQNKRKVVKKNKNLQIIYEHKEIY